MIFRSTSSRPILVVGNGVRSANAVALLQEFQAKTDIPVLTTMNAADLIQDESRLGFIGVYGNRVANTLVKESDLVISIGARLGLRQVGNKPEFFAPKAHLIRADIDKNELDRKVKQSEEPYLMDAKEFLATLLAEPIPKYTAWREKCFELKQVLSGCDREIGNLCMEKISSLLPESPIVAVDVGQHQCWSAQSLTLKGTAGRMLIGGGYGSMGCGLPYAIGASIACAKGPVYCITGDGGFQMNIQELQTIVREKLPVKILIINNKVLGKISEIQSAGYKGRYAQTTAQSGYTVPDFQKIAEAYGMKAANLASYEELAAYANWFVDHEPCLLNIMLPEDSKLIPKVNWNSKEILPALHRDVSNTVNRIFAPDSQTEL